MVDSRGAQERGRRLLGIIREGARTATALAAEAVIQSAMGRTPSVKHEYDILMAGEGATSSVPMAGGSSADSDGRQRLIKDESTYLQNIVPSPQNRFFSFGGDFMTFRFGNYELLQHSTVFRFTNKTSAGPKTYVQGPYFDNFEHGTGSVTIRPVNGRVRDGGFYPLRPDESTVTKSMTKSISPKNIFAGSTLWPVFTQALVVEFSRLGPGHHSL